MRALVFAAIALLLCAPAGIAAGVCTPYVIARACAGANAGNAVALDLVVLFSGEWRSAHAAVSPNGAGAAVHGHGPMTSGPLDVFAGFSGTQPYTGAYFCLGLWPWLPTSCGDALQHARRVAPALP